MKSQIYQHDCTCGKCMILVKVEVSRPRNFLTGLPTVKAKWLCKCGRQEETNVLYLEVLEMEV